MFEALRAKDYQVKFVSHAEAILKVDFPEAASELGQSLSLSFAGCLVPSGLMNKVAFLHECLHWADMLGQFDLAWAQGETGADDGGGAVECE